MGETAASPSDRSPDDSADVVVLGAGPAGLATATTAASYGLRIHLVDENGRVGGQISRLPFSGAPSPIEALPSNVTFFPRRVCVGWDAKTGFVLRSATGLERASGRAHVVAVGAYERAYPITGWTKVGVMTAGAAQTLLKGSGSFPYQRVVVAGTGPLLLASTAQLLRAGIHVVAFADSVRLHAGQVRYAPDILQGRSILAEGARYIGTILRRRTPVRLGWAVVEVLGDEAVEAVRIERVDQEGRPMGGASQLLPCDALILSQGFSPSTELVTQAGADLHWDAVRDAWAPDLDDAFETSVPGLFSVGDSAGVAGSQVAALEGELLGHLLGERLAGHPMGRRAAAARRSLARLGRFRFAMDEVFKVPNGVMSAADDGEIACRCQEVPIGDVRDAVRHGLSDPRAVKLWTRAGMGICQGRTCQHIVSAVTRDLSPNARPALASCQFPIRPMPLSALADPKNQPPTTFSERTPQV